MNSIHDMGGMHGFGRVEIEQNEPVYHEPWEGRVHAMQRMLSFMGMWTIDMSRASMEALPPQQYVLASYYERWLLGLESRVVENGLVGKDELSAGHALREGPKPERRFTRADIPNLKRGEYERPAPAEPRFAVGDKVRARNINPPTHTRLPRYARGKSGTIEAIRGCHVYPDTVAIGKGENPQWLYTVVFAASELWGEDAEPGAKVSIEAFEPYLLPA